MEKRRRDNRVVFWGVFSRKRKIDEDLKLDATLCRRQRVKPENLFAMQVIKSPINSAIASSRNFSSSGQSIIWGWQFASRMRGSRSCQQLVIAPLQREIISHSDFLCTLHNQTLQSEKFFVFKKVLRSMITFWVCIRMSRIYTDCLTLTVIFVSRFCFSFIFDSCERREDNKMRTNASLSDRNSRGALKSRYRNTSSSAFSYCLISLVEWRSRRFKIADIQRHWRQLINFALFLVLSKQS